VYNENDVTHENENENEKEHDVTHEMGEINDEINDNNTIDDDDISIKMEDHDDNHITIADINIIEQMNAAQLNTDPETGNDASENEWRNVSRHEYNLRA